MKYLLFLFFFIQIIGFTQAQPTKKTNPKQAKIKNQVLVGTLVKKPWTKTAESYCARGSDYYVLKANNPNQDEIVLENQIKVDLSQYENKIVKITGFRQKRIIEPDDNTMEQRPVTIDLEGKETAFTCEVFVIKGIK
jgi:hypothetical protein